jgi:hypothetical protein
VSSASADIYDELWFKDSRDEIKKARRYFRRTCYNPGGNWPGKDGSARAIDFYIEGCYGEDFDEVLGIVIVALLVCGRSVQCADN